MDDFVLKGKLSRNGQESYNAIRVDDLGSQAVTSKYAELAARGQVFWFSVAAVTVPVNASNLVAVYGLYNPPSSNKMLELIEVEAHAVVATTVVNALGLYSLSNQSAATFTTRVNTIRNARLHEGITSVAEAYSAVTFSGTPVLNDIIGGWGAVTDGGATPIRKQIDGKIQVPPGVLITLAMTTAASTASGITMGIKWAETPYAPQ